ncbi:MAG: hypothetical protein ACT4NJ_07140 [Nitrosopumilaceae archaeon]
MGIKTNSAYLFITCNAGKLDKVMTQIENLDNIKEIQGTHDEYDIIARVESTIGSFTEIYCAKN